MKSTRRTFIQNMGAALAMPVFSMSAYGDPSSGFPGSLESKREDTLLQQKKLGIALVGLGKYSTDQLAPALKETKNCYLAGIVTGSPHKAEEWKRRYEIPEGNIYNYNNFDSIKDNREIDIIYVVLPNSMHATFTMRAARAGKDVICEKPMAISVKECEDMIRVCGESDRLLSIGYRLHFEPYNLAIAEFNRNSKHGKILNIRAKHGFEVEPDVWRLDKALAGGGPLMDVGIYCVQAAIYATGRNPVSVTATEGLKTDKEKFNEVEQSLRWELEFEDGTIALCETSYAEEYDMLRVEGEHGWSELQPAYAYDGIRGRSDKGKMKLPRVNQQALQMDDFSNCVRQRKRSRVSGEMGLRDIKILMAIYEAAKTGKKIYLG